VPHCPLSAEEGAREIRGVEGDQDGALRSAQFVPPPNKGAQHHRREHRHREVDPERGIVEDEGAHQGKHPGVEGDEVDDRTDSSASTAAASSASGSGAAVVQRFSTSKPETTTVRTKAETRKRRATASKPSKKSSAPETTRTTPTRSRPTAASAPTMR